jgi:hypothetical protein
MSNNSRDAASRTISSQGQMEEITEIYLVLFMKGSRKWRIIPVSNFIRTKNIIIFSSNVPTTERFGLVFERYSVRTAVRIQTKLTEFFIIFPTLSWQILGEYVKITWRLSTSFPVGYHPTIQWDFNIRNLHVKEFQSIWELFCFTGTPFNILDKNKHTVHTQCTGLFMTEMYVKFFLHS